MDIFANMFELWGAGHFGTFSDEMYENNFYFPIAIWMIITNIAMLLLYYYGINHPRLNRWYWWLCSALILMGTNFLIAWGNADSQLYTLYQNMQVDCPYSFGTQFFPFASIVSLWTLMLYFILSMIFKWGSSNCKHSPFL